MGSTDAGQLDFTSHLMDSSSMVTFATREHVLLTPSGIPLPFGLAFGAKVV